MDTIITLVIVIGATVNKVEFRLLVLKNKRKNFFQTPNLVKQLSKHVIPYA